jgi:hypothetical protein
MRIEIILIGITIFIVGNIYTEGKWTKLVLSWKKYYQMGAVVVGAFFIYWLFKKNPTANWGQMISTTNDYIKYLPVDNQTSSFLTPILDFTSKQNIFGHMGGSGGSIIGGGGGSMIRGGGGDTVGEESGNYMNNRHHRMMQSGRNTNENGRVKRSVSETKKKFVASRQNWKCGECKKQLNAWFEVDHKIRLEHGGSNHVDNLVALCRECHGEKTTIENL